MYEIVKLGAAVIGLAITSTGCHAQQSALCLEAEGALSDVSVQIAKAYGADGPDGARKAGETALGKLDEGSDKGQKCGCTSAVSAAADARKLIELALRALGAEDETTRMTEALNAAETARLSAEKCWREAAKKGM
jgi:hypothetical protein